MRQLNEQFHCGTLNATDWIGSIFDILGLDVHTTFTSDIPNATTSKGLRFGR